MNGNSLNRNLFRSIVVDEKRKKRKYRQKRDYITKIKSITKDLPIWNIVKTLLLSLIITLILSLLMFYFFNDNSLYLIVKIMPYILTGFGIAYLTFIMIMTLFLPPILNKKQWYEAVRNTKTFRMIKKTFALSIAFDMSCIATGIAWFITVWMSKIVWKRDVLLLDVKLILFVSIFMLAYATFWVILNIEILKAMLTE